MNKFLPAFCIVVLLLASCGGSSKNDALLYDDKITGEYQRFSKVYTEYALSLNSDSAKLMQDQLEYANKQTSYSLDSANSIKDFDGDWSYVNSFRNYLTTVQKSLNEFDSPRIKLLQKDSLMTREDSSEVDRLTTESLYMTDKAYIEFQNAQKTFREKNNIKESDL